jgi:Undecaprenyl-phosphate glucose phosphotransferase
MDAIVVMLVSLLAQFVYAAGGATLTAGTRDSALGIGFLAGLLCVLISRSWGLYRFQNLISPNRCVPRVAAAGAVSILAVVCALFLLKVGASYSRGAMMVFALLAIFALPLCHIAIGAVAQAALQRGTIKGRRVVTIGETKELEKLSQEDFLNFGIYEVARVSLVNLAEGAVAAELDPTDRARIAQAVKAARRLRASEFAVMLAWSRERALSEVSGMLRASPLPVRLYPDERIRNILSHARNRDLDPHLSIAIQREPLSWSERAVKRLFDAGLSTIVLLTLSPLLLLTSLAIKLDSPGPAIFRQRRRGFDDRDFVIFKFRTMTVLEDNGPLVQAQRDDPRVTRFGRLLRRTSLDEMPQLLNVLRGDMSLVGPRPHAMAHDEEYRHRIGDYAMRHHVKPGLTGAAQVMGLRGETRTLAEMEERVERDLWYINNWSLALDLKILIQTVFTLMRHEAY